MWSYLNNSRHTYRSSNLPIDLVTTFTNGMGIYILYKYLPREIKKDFVKGKTGNEVIYKYRYFILTIIYFIINPISP